MDVTPLVKEGAQIIQSYAGGSFRVSGELYDGPVIVTANQTISWNDTDDFQPLIDMACEIDVVLLGTGAQIQFMEPGIKKSLNDKGLSVDVMDTGAACRTYNVLMAEGRRVAAALFSV